MQVQMCKLFFFVSKIQITTMYNNTCIILQFLVGTYSYQCPNYQLMLIVAVEEWVMVYLLV